MIFSVFFWKWVIGTLGSLLQGKTWAFSLLAASVEISENLNISRRMCLPRKLFSEARSAHIYFQLTAELWERMTELSSFRTPEGAGRRTGWGLCFALHSCLTFGTKFQIFYDHVRNAINTPCMHTYEGRSSHSVAGIIKILIHQTDFSLIRLILKSFFQIRWLVFTSQAFSSTAWPHCWHS